MEGQNETIEIALVGESEVGKTSIVERFEYNSFPEEFYSSRNISYSEKKVKFTNGYKCIIKNTDFPGNERYKSLLSHSISGASAVALVYSLDMDLSSFDGIEEKWLEVIKGDDIKSKIIALVINKIDLLNENKEYEDKILKLKDFAQKNDLLFFSTSAKENKGITELYEGLMRKIKKWDEEVKLAGEVENKEEEEEGEDEEEEEEEDDEEEVENEEAKKNKKEIKEREQNIKKEDEKIEKKMVENKEEGEDEEDKEEMKGTKIYNESNKKSPDEENENKSTSKGCFECL